MNIPSVVPGHSDRVLIIIVVALVIPDLVLGCGDQGVFRFCDSHRQLLLGHGDVLVIFRAAEAVVAIGRWSFGA